MPLNAGEEGQEGEGREGDCKDVFDLDLDWECLDLGRGWGGRVDCEM